MDTVSRNFKIPTNEWVRLKEVAAHRNMTPAALVRESVRLYPDQFRKLDHLESTIDKMAAILALLVSEHPTFCGKSREEALNMVMDMFDFSKGSPVRKEFKRWLHK